MTIHKNRPYCLSDCTQRACPRNLLDGEVYEEAKRRGMDLLLEYLADDCVYYQEPKETYV